MIRIIHFLSVISLSLFMGSCASSRPAPVCFTNADAPVIVNAEVKLDQQLPYSSFKECALQPVGKNVNNLFQQLIKPGEECSYAVEFGEADLNIQSAEVESWSFEFAGESKKFEKPVLKVMYFALDPNVIWGAHNQLIATTGFKQKRELSMVKKDFADSTAAFRTKEFGPELQYVVRAITGPNNIMAVIRMCDKADSPTISKEEMIARVGSLSKDDIFPLDLVRYRVDESLRDLELQFAASIVERDHFDNECRACASLLNDHEAVAHVIIKANKDADNVQCVLQRPLIGKVVQQESLSLKSMKEEELCIGSRSVIPGEPMVVSMQDANGILIEKYKFCPNPIVVKSIYDDATITFELLDAENYYVTGNLNEKVEFESVSMDERMIAPINFSDDRAGMLYSPGVIGERGGIAHLKFTRESGEELKVSLPWGTAVDKIMETQLKVKG